MKRLYAVLAFAASAVQAHDPVTTKLTWSQEISRIVQRRCASCHSSSSPVPLTTYEQARPWAKAIKDEVLNRRMPPWGAVKGFGDFAEDPSLTQAEITSIAEWVEGGAPEGDPMYLNKTPAVPPRPLTLPKGRWVRTLSLPKALIAIRPLGSVASAQVVAHLPDGSVLPLIWLREYDEKWKRAFVYREPIALPKGTRVIATPDCALEYLVR